MGGNKTSMLLQAPGWLVNIAQSCKNHRASIARSSERVIAGDSGGDWGRPVLPRSSMGLSAGALVISLLPSAPLRKPAPPPDPKTSEHCSEEIGPRLGG